MDAGRLSGRTGKGLGGLDCFRLPAALLVAAVHTGPLLTLNATANFILTDILARLAVPFFFAVSGFFLVPRFLERGAAELRRFLQKILSLYGLSILLYLPLMIYNGYFQGPGLAWKLLRDFFFDGTFYHLWYFPAAALGACIVFPAVRKLGLRGALLPCGALYFLGLLGDSYHGLAAAFPPLNAAYGALFSLFDYTRNGVFFAPLFLLLGGLLARREDGRRPGFAGTKRYAAGCLASLLLLTAEGLMVKQLSLARHDSMYVLLPLCLWFLFRTLERVKRPGLPWLRTLSTVVYIVHPLCIVGVRGAGRLFGLLSDDGFLLGSSLVHYLAVVLASCALSLPFLFARRQTPARERSRAWAEIDLDALRHNVNTLRGLLPEGCGLMAVVKADAYGHGAALTARACMAEGVAAFAVASASEGVALRKSGVKGEILILGYTDPALVPLLARWRLMQTVTSVAYAGRLEAGGRTLRVHLAVDTGMHRLGIPWDDASAMTGVFACRHLKIKGMFTHLYDAESVSASGDSHTLEQLGRFHRAAEALRARGLDPGALHVQGSYGMLNYSGAGPAEHYGYARAGIALYGVLSNEDDHTRLAPDLRPVLSLHTRVAQVQDIPPGVAAGYDGAFLARRPTRLATVTIGYADGYPRSLSRGVGSVLVRGRRAPVAGLICMDQMLADVTDIPGVAEGDVVTLIGRDGDETLTAGEVAGAAGTITNELLCRLGARVARVPKANAGR